MTKTERLIELLIATGHTEVTAQHKTRKYRVFLRPDRPSFVYVGKCAAVRFGKTVSDSYSQDSDQFIRYLSKLQLHQAFHPEPANA